MLIKRVEDLEDNLESLQQEVNILSHFVDELSYRIIDLEKIVSAISQTIDY